ncbi:excinuclease ABC subunit UvrC [SAR202 cluster bacterium AD-802-E10_MRT_200m]|nr:excinuclease ABC subunit UvrC [SAR202 cluster bacterium AD-802-E10_MRT_200m]
MTAIGLMKQRIASVPKTCGVYFFKDRSNRLLYVGKATSLRQRLGSYFGQQSSLTPKIRKMLSLAQEFEFLITQSDSEALILENTLIKKHKPPYNTRLRDDKTYPYIKIDLKEEFPLVRFTREVAEDGAKYFGPFASAGSVRTTLNLLKKLFPYRTCTKTITGEDNRPCLEYYIHRCIAPCTGFASKEQYHQVIREVLLFLEGKTENVTKTLRTKMKTFSDTLAFEQAGIVRDQLRAIKKVNEEQKVVSTKRVDYDVIALAQGENEARVEISFIRNGKLLGRDHFTMIGTHDDQPEQILTVFVKQFYNRSTYIPSRILSQYPINDVQEIEAWFTEISKRSVKIKVPQRGIQHRLIKMVAENAKQALNISSSHDSSARIIRPNVNKTLEELQELLNLPRIPFRIECYDISNNFGDHAVGSLVVFEQGTAKRSNYRRFKIKSIKQIDDYSMMGEVLKRRLKRLQSPGLNNSKISFNHEKSRSLSSTTWDKTPDLVMIDGGKGHLSAIQSIFLDLGIQQEDIPLASIAKRHEEIFVPGSLDPITLPRKSNALHLIQRIRDEAHRFAISYHRSLRSKTLTLSQLDEIVGIGPARKQALFKQFKSVNRMQIASINELIAVPGITMIMAQQIKALTD